jgi:hypothetical protein
MPTIDVEATVFVVVVIALGFVPLLRGTARLSLSLSLTRGALILWVGLGVIGWTQLSFRLPPEGEHLVVDRPTEIDSDGYRSSDTCRACHPEQYDSWYSTYHRTMTQVAEEDSVLGDFGEGPLRWRDDRWTVSQAEGRFFVQEEGGSRHRVVLTTGSNHMQIYWYSRDGGRDLSQFPFVWLRAEGRWTPDRRRLSARLTRVPETSRGDGTGRASSATRPTANRASSAPTSWRLVSPSSASHARPATGQRRST